MSEALCVESSGSVAAARERGFLEGYQAALANMGNLLERMPGPPIIIEYSPAAMGAFELIRREMTCHDNTGKLTRGTPHCDCDWCEQANKILNGVPPRAV